MTTSTKKKSKIATAMIVSALALTMVGTTFTTEAEAGRKGRYFAGGVAAGIIGSAIIAGSHRRYHDGYSRSSRWERHVRRCYRAYRSYDERTDTFIGYDGIERRCRK